MSTSPIVATKTTDRKYSPRALCQQGESSFYAAVVFVRSIVSGDTCTGALSCFCEKYSFR